MTQLTRTTGVGRSAIYGLARAGLPRRRRLRAPAAGRGDLAAIRGAGVDDFRFRIDRVLRAREHAIIVLAPHALAPIAAFPPAPARRPAPRPRYPLPNVHAIEKPDGTRYRLDAYDPAGGGEIVSRKFSQLADVDESTALSYMRELKRKYCPGDKIASVPSNGSLAGERLRGKQILEIPVQERPVPARVLQEASSLRITLRDVNGKVY